MFDGAEIYRKLYAKLTKNNLAITFDTTKNDIKTVLFIEAPTKKTFRKIRSLAPKAKLVCVVFESPAIMGFDADWLLANMDILLSWCCTIENSKHIYIPYPKAETCFSYYPDRILDYKNSQFCMFAGNKFSFKRGELYSKRREIVKIFETSRRTDFTLYGPGWKNFHFFGLPFTNRVRSFQFLRGPRCYGSVVADKISVMSKFKFSFALENFESDAGYISEKIHDCFRAGTVPIYLGDKNISRVVPSDAIILMDDFSSISECVNYCSNMSDELYLRMLESIIGYVQSDGHDVEHVVDSIYGAVYNV